MQKRPGSDSGRFCVLFFLLIQTNTSIETVCFYGVYRSQFECSVSPRALLLIAFLIFPTQDIYVLEREILQVRKRRLLA